jgi:hypothetical protein
LRLLSSSSNHARPCANVEVAEVGAVTECARRFGASVLLEARNGPAGWRRVVVAPAGGEIAFRQPK